MHRGTHRDNKKAIRLDIALYTLHFTLDIALYTLHFTLPTGVD